MTTPYLDSPKILVPYDNYGAAVKAILNNVESLSEEKKQAAFDFLQRLFTDDSASEGCLERSDPVLEGVHLGASVSQELSKSIVGSTKTTWLLAAMMLKGVVSGLVHEMPSSVARYLQSTGHADCLHASVAPPSAEQVAAWFEASGLSPEKFPLIQSMLEEGTVEEAMYQDSDDECFDSVPERTRLSPGKKDRPSPGKKISLLALAEDNSDDDSFEEGEVSEEEDDESSDDEAPTLDA